MSTSLTVSTSEQWEVLQRQCKAFVNSGLLPDHITSEGTGYNKTQITIEKAIARAITIAIKGKELGIPPMHAFNSITVIKGKTCLSSELMLSLLYQRLPGASVTYTKTDNLGCTLVIQRPKGQPQEFSFTIEDAKTAGLSFKPDSAWVKYPAAMCRARTVSAALRAVAPDVLMGVYTPEEIGGVVEAEEIQPDAKQVEVEDVTEAEPQEPTKMSEDENAKPPKSDRRQQVEDAAAVAGEKTKKEIATEKKTNDKKIKDEKAKLAATMMKQLGLTTKQSRLDHAKKVMKKTASNLTLKDWDKFLDKLDKAVREASKETGQAPSK